MMTSILWIVGIAAVFFLFVLLYALCRVSADADEQAGYMEEYMKALMRMSCKGSSFFFPQNG